MIYEYEPWLAALRSTFFSATSAQGKEKARRDRQAFRSKSQSVETVPELS
jgi:hypothetical protein